MPVSAGEVEAVTRMKYISDLKEGLAADNRDLKKFQADYATALSGPLANPTLINIQTEMQGKIAATREEIKKLGGAAKEAEESFGGMDAIIQRMLIRVGILMAIRGAFNFMEGVFENAAMLERLNAQFDVTTTKLQQLQYAGTQTDIPFDKISTAISTLQKNLAEFKGGEVLHELGLNFKEMVSLTKDQQIDTVFNALAGSADRVRQSAILLGTDGLAPLITGWKNLADAADKAGAAIGEDHLRRLAEADALFKKMAENTRIAGADMVVFGMETKAALATFNGWAALFTGGIQGLTAYTLALDAVNAKTKEAAKAGPTPLMGQAYIDSLRQEVKLSDEMVGKLEQLDRMHQLTAETAARGADADAAQYREFIRNKQAEIAAEREHDQVLLTQYRSRQQGLELTEKEGIATRKLMTDKANLLRIQSDLSDAEMKTFSSISPIADAKSHISDLMAQDAAEKALMQSVIINLHTEQERAKVYADYGKVHEQIANKILAEEEKITKALTTQAEAARKARQERMNEAGLRLDSSPTDANLNPFDAAARHYGETLQEIDRLQQAMAITEQDANELRLQALREEQKAFDAANKAIYGLTTASQLADSSLKSLAATPGSTFVVPPNKSSFPQPYYLPPGGYGYQNSSGGVTSPQQRDSVPDAAAMRSAGAGGITVNLTMHGVMASDSMALQAVINEGVMRAAKSVRKFGSQ